MSKQDGGPAFPGRGGISPTGMTLRDWFAGQALAGIAINWKFTAIPIPSVDCQEMASDAYAMADAMLATREPSP